MAGSANCTIRIVKRRRNEKIQISPSLNGKPKTAALPSDVKRKEALFSFALAELQVLLTRGIDLAGNH